MNFDKNVEVREKHFIKHNEFNKNFIHISLSDLAKYYEQVSNIKDKIRILELGTKRSNINIPTHHKQIFNKIKSFV